VPPADFAYSCRLWRLACSHSTGHIELSESFYWMSSPVALIAFGSATVLEIVAYFVPFVDNVLDTVASPAAVVAGTVVSASVMTDVSPFVQWSLAAIMGVGVTAPVQAATAATRGVLTLTTAGIGNPVFSAGEVVGAGVMTALGVFSPIVAVVIALFMVGGSFFMLRFGLRKIREKRAVRQNDP
jgi:uncharacterized membrane protein